MTQNNELIERNKQWNILTNKKKQGNKVNKEKQIIIEEVQIKCLKKWQNIEIKIKIKNLKKDN